MSADTTHAALIGEAGRPQDIADCPDLDPVQLAELGQVLAPDQVLTLVQSYYASTADLLATLDRAAADADWAQLRELAHDLKGTSGSFGACRLQHLAEALEQCCARQQGEEACALVAAMHQALAGAWSAIETQLAAMGA